MTCPVFISTIIISVKGDLPCFAECFCGPGGVFHHAYEGWSSAFCGALICNEDETADDHTLSNTPSTSFGCTLAPEDLKDRPPPTACIGDCRSKESMPTSVGVGSYASIAHGKRWYVAKVNDVQDGVFGVSYTTPCRGKWKWGRTDEGEVVESDIIMTLPEPCAVGNLFQVKAEENDVVDRLFSSISVDL